MLVLSPEGSARSPGAPGYSAEWVPQPKGWGTHARTQKDWLQLFHQIN
jgi:hypothetical protein